MKILDFGLARVKPKVLSAEHSSAPTVPNITEPGMVMGTPAYMSPEQVRGEEADPTSDIFSFGSVLYEMVTGRRAFARRTAAETMAAILKDEPPKQAEASQDVPPELERVINRCLKKKAGERFQSARDLAIDLETMLSGAAIPTPAPARLSKRTHPAVWVAAMLALLLAGLLLYRPMWRGQPVNQPIDSIAVLPLVNASGDADTEYLSDGLTEDLINSLSHLSKLRVIARTTVFRYKGREVDPIKVGGELKVRAVLTGRVILRGDTLNIQADLMDVASGAQLWGEKFNKKLTDIFAVQEEIARRIANGLRLKLPGAEQQRLTKRYTENIEAYQLYHEGRLQAFKFSKEGMEKAPAYLLQAIQLDPDYALAYAGLAEYYMIYMAGPKWGIKAREAALKAVELDETLAEAHYSLAVVKAFYDWEWSQAEREFKRAIELTPGSASAHDWYGLYLVVMGRVDDSIATLRRAQQLDPFSVHVNFNLGRAFYWARRYGEAIEQLRMASVMDPNHPPVNVYLGLAYEQRARYEEAIAAYQKTIGTGFPDGLAYVGHALAVSGKRGEARKVLDELKLAKPRTVSPWGLAALYVGLGEKDQAFEWLDKAYEERFAMIASLKVDPVFDSLRADPRFANLLRRIGLALNRSG